MRRNTLAEENVINFFYVRKEYLSSEKGKAERGEQQQGTGGSLGVRAAALPQSKIIQGRKARRCNSFGCDSSWVASLERRRGWG